MFTKLILLLALVSCTLAKLNPKETVLDGRPVSHAGAVVIDGVSKLNNLTMPCNNKFCEMLKYTASCKSLNLGMKKVCAIHLLGYRYGCDAFPSPSAVRNAPSICIPAAQRILTPLTANASVALAAILTPYLNPADFEADNCDRQCFQNFQYATHDFFSTCRPELSSAVKIASLMSAFQEYRNQACAKNPAGDNCYTSIMALVSPSARLSGSSAASHIALSPEGELVQVLQDNGASDWSVLRESVKMLESLTAVVMENAAENSAGFDSAVLMESDVEAVPEGAAQVSAKGSLEDAEAADAEAHRSLQSAPDLLDFTCAYTASGIPANFVLGATCTQLSGLGCCAATGITMVQQNPVSSIAALASGGTANPVVFPPCLYRYMTDACPTVDLANYCTNGSIASTTVHRGSFLVSLSPSTGLQNLYTKTGTLNMMGIIQLALVAVAPSLRAWPYLFTNPLQIQIVDYTYFSGNGVTPLTPTNGLAYNPVGGDYTAANSAQVTYQIVNQDLDATTAATLTAVLSNAAFFGAVSRLSTGGATAAAVNPITSPTAAIFEPTPLVIRK